jgi:hypothetical protein
MNALRHSDYYMVTVDFDAYYATQRSVEKLWLSTSDWTRASMLNIARMAWLPNKHWHRGCDAPALAQFAPSRCRDQLPKRPVMQSHGITLSFHREMADSQEKAQRLLD